MYMYARRENLHYYLSRATLKIEGIYRTAVL